jgi:putative component of toxin-antitoxin plasmid stabilization module
MADAEIAVLLRGGDKRTQDADMAKAKNILKELEHV